MCRCFIRIRGMTAQFYYRKWLTYTTFTILDQKQKQFHFFCSFLGFSCECYRSPFFLFQFFKAFEEQNVFDSLKISFVRRKCGSTAKKNYFHVENKKYFDVILNVNVKEQHFIKM